MLIELPFPDKVLWPNGRTRNHRFKAARVRLHREWAQIATRTVAPPCFAHNGEQIPVSIEVCPQGRGQAPDADNCIAAAKAYLDGIADALKVNDRAFAAPTVTFGPRTAKFFIRIGGQA